MRRTDFFENASRLRNSCATLAARRAVIWAGRRRVDLHNVAADNLEVGEAPHELLRPAAGEAPDLRRPRSRRIKVRTSKKHGVSNESADS
ncbi:MAG TPA: hypothetical protein VE691_13215 [Rubrobacter sp.]|nr:hypothetical protein [Rubrobacter sp.]